MTKKVYRTAQGKFIDIGALELQNEQVRAVGNMNVNARGDRVNELNQPIDSRNQQVKRQYQKQVSKSNVSNTPVMKSARHAEEVAAQANKAKAQSEEASERFDLAEADTTEKLTGLAAALARAEKNKGE